MASDSFLSVAEDFYSIQGEGACAGVPAVFLRLAGCTMRCQGFSYQDPSTGEHLGCDTALVWRAGRKEALSDIIARWRSHGHLEKLEQGAHLVVTGGEPLIQQPALKQFIKQLDAALRRPAFIELETNASFSLDGDLMQRIGQVNASPKLANSGEPLERRYHPKVLAELALQPHVLFKFVISQPEDVLELISRYQEPFSIPAHRIWLMPEGGTREAIAPKQAWLVELCKENLFNYSSRLHIHIWDEATGV